MENPDQKPPPWIDVQGPDSDGAYDIEVDLSEEEFKRWQAIADAPTNWQAFKAAKIKVREYPEFLWSTLDYLWFNYVRHWWRRRTFR